MVRIIMPQAVKNIIPAIGNEIIALLKETAIIALVGSTVGTLTFDLSAAANTVTFKTKVRIAAYGLKPGIVKTAKHQKNSCNATGVPRKTVV